MDGIDWRFWSVVLLVWVIVPFGVSSTASFFNEDASYTSRTWDDITTDARSDEVALENRNITRNITNALALINSKIVANVATFTVQTPFIGGLISRAIENTIFSMYGATPTTTYSWWEMNTIVLADRFFGWAIQPIADYYLEFNYSLAVIQDEFGVPSIIVSLAKALFWFLPLLLFVLLIMRLIEVIGGITPFT